MTGPVESENPGFKELYLLVFKVMGIRMGIDVDEVDEMLEPDQLEGTSYKIFPLHEKIPFRGGPVLYKSPKVLLLKEVGTDLKSAATGLLIDQPEDILSVSIDSIHPLPPLLEARNRPAVIWGAALKEGEVILLIDFYKLLRWPFSY